MNTHRLVSTKSLLFVVLLCGFSLFIIDGADKRTQAAQKLRIVSLVPSLTESLFDLEAGDSLVGATEYCLYPVEAQKIERVGSVVSINSERIVQLRPDFILALGMTEQNSVKKLKRLGFTVHHFQSPENFQAICDQFKKLGALCNRSENADRIVRECENEVQLIARRVSALPPRRVFIQLGSRPLFAATGQSFTSDYLRYGGGINIAEKSPLGLLSREAVLAADPEIIIIAAMGVHTAEEISQWKQFRSMTAVINNRLHVVDAVRYCVPTPRGFVVALRQTVHILHPQAEI